MRLDTLKVFMSEVFPPALLCEVHITALFSHFLESFALPLMKMTLKPGDRRKKNNNFAITDIDFHFQKSSTTLQTALLYDKESLRVEPFIFDLFVDIAVNLGGVQGPFQVYLLAASAYRPDDGVFCFFFV